MVSDFGPYRRQFISEMAAVEQRYDVMNGLLDELARFSDLDWRQRVYGGSAPKTRNYRSFTPAQHEAAGEALLANLEARSGTPLRRAAKPEPTPYPGQAALDLMLHGNAFVIAGSPAHEEMLEMAHLRNEMVRTIEIWQERQ